MKFSENKTARAILVIVLAALVLSTLLSCAEEEIRPEKTEHTFFIYSIDRSAFSARIDWGVDKLQDKERVSSWGFASSVELRPGEELILLVDRPGLAAQVTNNKTGVSRIVSLDPGELAKIKPL